MPIMTAIPLEFAGALNEISKKARRGIELVIQEGNTAVYMWTLGSYAGAVANTLDTLSSECVAHNTLAYSGNTTMWRHSVHFDHTGEAVTKMGWAVDVIEREIAFVRHSELRRVNERETEIWIACDLLCGPSFDSNQLEYSKRHKLRSFLSD